MIDVFTKIKQRSNWPINLNFFVVVGLVITFRTYG